jgi:hypothetical protein
MQERVQLRRKKGWKMPPDTLKVDRSTKWGNPFVVGKHGTAERCVELFARLCSGQICISTASAHVKEQEAFLRHASANIASLRGKNLACWCKADKPCHADVLLDWANDT